MRRAQARLELGFGDRALKDLEKAHQLDPKQTEIPGLIEEAKKRVADARLKKSGPEIAST